MNREGEKNQRRQPTDSGAFQRLRITTSVVLPLGSVLVLQNLACSSSELLNLRVLLGNESRDNISCWEPIKAAQLAQLSTHRRIDSYMNRMLILFLVATVYHEPPHLPIRLDSYRPDDPKTF